MLIKIWNCIVGIIFYGLILGHHEFIFSYVQTRKDLTFYLLRPSFNLLTAEHEELFRYSHILYWFLLLSVKLIWQLIIM